MKFTSDVAKRISKHLDELLPGMKCPLCHTDDWIIANGYVYLPVEEYTDPLYRSVARKSGELPCAAITCKLCGNTHLLNLLALGLGDLLKD